MEKERAEWGLGRKKGPVAYIPMIKGPNERNDGSAIKNIRGIESGAKKMKKFF